MADWLTELGNLLFIVSSLFAVGYSVYWRATGKLDETTKKVVRAWELIYVSILLLRLWWVLGLKFANEYSMYHPFFTNNKHFVTLPLGLVFTVGVVHFITAIGDIKKGEQLLYVVGALFVATLLAVL